MFNKGYRVGYESRNPNYIGDYYLLNNKTSEFTFMAWRSEVESFALNKSFLYDVIFDKYPSILSEMKGYSLQRYNREIKKPVVNNL